MRDGKWNTVKTAEDWKGYAKNNRPSHEVIIPQSQPEPEPVSETQPKESWFKKILNKFRPKQEEQPTPPSSPEAHHPTTSTITPPSPLNQETPRFISRYEAEERIRTIRTRQRVNRYLQNDQIVTKSPNGTSFIDLQKVKKESDGVKSPW